MSQEKKVESKQVHFIEDLETLRNGTTMATTLAVGEETGGGPQTGSSW